MKWVTTRGSIWWVRITFLIHLFQSFGIIIYGVLNTIQLGHGTKSFALSNYQSRALIAIIKIISKASDHDYLF